MIETILYQTPKSKKTVKCTEDELYLTGRHYYDIDKYEDSDPFNKALFNAQVDKIVDIAKSIYTKKKLNTYNIKVNWIKKNIKTNWDNQDSTIRIYKF